MQKYLKCEYLNAIFITNYNILLTTILLNIQLRTFVKCIY